MASIWQITLSGYDAQAASESGQSATGKIALGTWGSYGHETIQVTLAEPWDVCTLVTATFWPTYPPDHWDTPGIRVALGTDGLLTVPPEASVTICSMSWDLCSSVISARTVLIWSRRA